LEGNLAVIAYYRVSTADQTIENQRMEIAKTYRVDKEFMDEAVSGTVAGMNRDGFSKMMEFVREGDTLVLVDLDRIGRDAIDVQTNIRTLKEKRVNVIVTRLGVDLSTDAGDLLVTILSKVAEMERRKMLERANAGRERARAEGKPLGRKPKVDAEKIIFTREQYSIAETARQLGVSVATVKRMQREAKVTERP
jgi:DNA invertase Pin-like site-specific DNA recombinase